MPNIQPTPQALLLANALKEKGIDIETEHWDGHKHIDIFIPKAKIYIEVDGLPHFSKPERILSDFERDYYSSRDGFFTKRIPNELINTHLNEITDAIAKVVTLELNKIK